VLLTGRSGKGELAFLEASMRGKSRPPRQDHTLLVGKLRTYCRGQTRSIEEGERGRTFVTERSGGGGGGDGSRAVRGGFRKGKGGLDRGTNSST